MKTLIAGPWVGEFGWELFAWQGYIRAMAKKFDKTIIISRKNSKAIYDDFADEYVSYDPTGGDADSFFIHGVDFKNCIKEVFSKNNFVLNKDTSLFIPRRIGIPPFTHHTQHMILGNHVIQPEYISFGEKAEEQYDYIFHIRNRNLRKKDNWNLENWEKLKHLLGDKKIACIGTKKESGHLEGTEDLRDIALGKLFNVLKGAECCFGPSSGPIHLASLCGCPHVVWSLASDKIRYEENWNPLNTRVLFDSKYEWHPDPEYIYEQFTNWVDQGENNK